MYHYFTNRQGLVAAVEKERYRRLALAEDQRHLDLGARSATAGEFLQFIAEQLVRIVTDPQAIEVRRQRFRFADVDAWIAVALPAALAPLRLPPSPEPG